MNKKKNIAIIGLGNIGSYFYKYVNSNKNVLFNKTTLFPNISYVSARNKSDPPPEGIHGLLGKILNK